MARWIQRTKWISQRSRPLIPRLFKPPPTQRFGEAATVGYPMVGGAKKRPSVFSMLKTIFAANSHLNENIRVFRVNPDAYGNTRSNQPSLFPVQANLKINTTKLVLNALARRNQQPQNERKITSGTKRASLPWARFPKEPWISLFWYRLVKFSIVWRAVSAFGGLQWSWENGENFPQQPLERTRALMVVGKCH